MSCNKCKNWQAIHDIRIAIEVALDYLEANKVNEARIGLGFAKKDILELEGS